MALTAPTVQRLIVALGDNNAGVEVEAAINAGGGGSGTVNSGTSGQVAYYAGTGTAVSGEAIATLIGSGGIGTTQLASAGVTYAKVQNVAATALLGNPTGSPAAPSEITLAANSGLVFTGTTLATTSISASGMLDASFDNTQGDILYRGSSAWTYLGPGTANYVLATGGASANPAWASTNLQIDSHQGAITADTQSTGTWTVNLATSDWHTITLTQSISTLTLSNGKVGQQFTLVIIQGGSGSYTVAWPSNTKWPGGAAPTLTTSTGGIDVITIKIVSTGHYYAFVAGQALA